MANAEAELGAGAKTGRNGGKFGLLIGVALAAILGGAGFYAVSTGMILGEAAPAADVASKASAVPALPLDVAFVELEPITVSLGPDSPARQLRFRGQLEVTSGAEAAVAKLSPRIVDVLNAYLRAVAPAELADPGALTLLRAQMLRRIQIVTGGGQVRDLLISEFVLN